MRVESLPQKASCLNKHNWEKLTIIVLTGKNWKKVIYWVGLCYAGSWLIDHKYSQFQYNILSKNKSLFVRYLSENILLYSLTLIFLENILLLLILILAFAF